MKFSIRFADKIVGTLVIAGLAVLILVVFMIGRSQRWFKTDYQYVTFFETASGLGKNMPVQYKGFTIGHVKDFHLAEDDRVEVFFTIFEEYRDRWVKEGSLVEVNASPIGLGNSFLFYPGAGHIILEEGSLIPDVNSKEGKQFIAGGMTSKIESGDSISSIVNNVNGLLESINISFSGAQEAENLPLGQILNDVSRITANLSLITDGLSDPDGTVMRALDGEGPVYNDLVSMLNSVSGTLDNVKRTTHVLPSHLPVVLNDLSIVLRDAQDTLTAVQNNPLLRGGVPERVETGVGGSSNRELEF